MLGHLERRIPCLELTTPTCEEKIRIVSCEFCELDSMHITASIAIRVREEIPTSPGDGLRDLAVKIICL
jgi:hypothetical protein